MKISNILWMVMCCLMFQNCVNREGSNTNGSIVTYSSQTIAETSDNDGTFDEEIDVILSGSTFNTTLVKGTDYGTSNLPSGLTVTFTRTSSTTGTIEITGQTSQHSFCNDTRMSFFFTKTAFTDNKLPTAFEIPITIEWQSPRFTFSETDIVEDSANDGSISQTVTITLSNGGSFTDPSTTLTEGTDYEWEDLPTGLTSVIDVDASGTEATLSWTGNADDSTPFYDVRAKLIFLDAALSEDFCISSAFQYLDFEFYRSVILYAASNTDGNIGGRTGADDMCLLALTDGLPEDYTEVHAFLSVGSGDEIQDMPTLYNVPTSTIIESETGEKIGDNWADLLDDTIDTDLSSADVFGATVDYWTGSDSDGSISGDTCSGWTSTSADGEVGISNATDQTWMDNGVEDCAEENRLLCVVYIPE